jgi:hypothetical protein
VNEAPYFADRKPRRRPACRSANVLPIVYGYPDFELLQEAEAGRVALGGCCLTGADPSWRCMDCETPVFSERLRRLYEESPDEFMARRRRR